MSSAQGASYSLPEQRKEEFRRYLEKENVVEAITKVLVGLYEEPERPADAVGFVKKYFGGPMGIDIEATKQENQELKDENNELKKIIKELSKKNLELRERLEEYEEPQ